MSALVAPPATLPAMCARLREELDLPAELRTKALVEQACAIVGVRHEVHLPRARAAARGAWASSSPRPSPPRRPPPPPPAPAAAAGPRTASHADLPLARYAPGLCATLSLSFPGLQLIHAEPPVLLVNGFLSAAECDRVVAKARATACGRASSRTPRERRAAHERSLRSCRGARRRRRRRLLALLGQRDAERLEGLQVVKYDAGQFFRPHCDSSDGLYSHSGFRLLDARAIRGGLPPSTPRGARSGMKLSPLCVYLADRARRRARTRFPRLNGGAGLQRAAGNGHAVIHFPTVRATPQAARTCATSAACTRRRPRSTSSGSSRRGCGVTRTPAATTSSRTSRRSATTSSARAAARGSSLSARRARAADPGRRLRMRLQPGALGGREVGARTARDGAEQRNASAHAAASARVDAVGGGRRGGRRARETRRRAARGSARRVPERIRFG